MVVPDSYNAQILCLDSLGDIMFGVLTLVQMGIQYSKNVNYYFWLALMPPYIYQAAFGFLQTMDYCSLPDEYVVLERVGYEKLITNGSTSDVLDLLV